jgi:HupE/UreJ protein
MKRAFVAILVLAMPAWAHRASDAYLTLRVEGASIAAQWDIALRDLADSVGADIDGDGDLTWGELRARKAYLVAWALGRLSVSAEGRPCAPGPVELLTDAHDDGAYAVLRFALQCSAAPASVTVAYRLLFDTDALHRGILRLDAGGQTQTAVFAPSSATQTFDLAGTSALAQMGAFVRDGVRHIWSGFDHVLFLLALLLPAVLRREGGRWVPVASFRPALAEAAKVVTAFTIAHSVTLSISALGILRLPSRLVESGIALSVALAGLDNLWPVFRARRWAVAFAFGLLHGFGFASALVDLGLPRASLVRALLGFNVGVELGQLAIVIAFLEGAFAVRNSVAYQRVALKAGSLAIVALSSVWFVERLLP